MVSVHGKQFFKFSRNSEIIRKHYSYNWRFETSTAITIHVVKYFFKSSINYENLKMYYFTAQVRQTVHHFFHFFPHLYCIEILRWCCSSTKYFHTQRRGWAFSELQWIVIQYFSRLWGCWLFIVKGDFFFTLMKRLVHNFWKVFVEMVHRHCMHNNFC